MLWKGAWVAENEQGQAGKYEGQALLHAVVAGLSRSAPFSAPALTWRVTGREITITSDSTLGSWVGAGIGIRGGLPQERRLLMTFLRINLRAERNERGFWGRAGGE